MPGVQSCPPKNPAPPLDQTIALALAPASPHVGHAIIIAGSLLAPFECQQEQADHHRLAYLAGAPSSVVKHETPDAP